MVCYSVFCLLTLNHSIQGPKIYIKYDQLVSSGTIKCGPNALELKTKGVAREAGLQPVAGKPSTYRIYLKKGDESKGETAAEFEWSSKGVRLFGEEVIRQAGLDTTGRRNWTEIIYHPEAERPNNLKGLNAKMLGSTLKAGQQGKSVSKRGRESGNEGLDEEKEESRSEIGMSATKRGRESGNEGPDEEEEGSRRPQAGM